MDANHPASCSSSPPVSRVHDRRGEPVRQQLDKATEGLVLLAPPVFLRFRSGGSISQWPLSWAAWTPPQIYRRLGQPAAAAAAAARSVQVSVSRRRRSAAGRSAALATRGPCSRRRRKQRARRMVGTPRRASRRQLVPDAREEAGGSRRCRETARLFVRAVSSVWASSFCIA